LSILSTPEEPSETHSAPPISAAVDAALRRKSAIDQARLKAEEETRAESKKNEVYFHACRELIGNVESIVDAFNKSFQHGNIATHLRDGIFDQLRGVRYAVPNGQAIFIEFFDRRDTGMNILSGTLSGGGVMGVEKGPSANLLRICTPDDMYGKWWICEVDLMALANPQRLIGQYGLRSDTVVPFGFTNAQHFYDQIRYAASGMHVFTYKFREDVKNYFSELLTHACQ
jgi:hypothetical protein